MLYNFEQEQSPGEIIEKACFNLHTAKRYRSSLKYEGIAWWSTCAQYSRTGQTHVLHEIDCMCVALTFLSRVSIVTSPERQTNKQKNSEKMKNKYQ